MYEPKDDTTFPDGCADKILLYVKILFYGIPSLMLVSLLSAFVVSASVSSAERRRKAARRGEEPGFNSQYSIGASEDFHHTSYHDALPQFLVRSLMVVLTWEVLQSLAAT